MRRGSRRCASTRGGWPGSPRRWAPGWRCSARRRAGCAVRWPSPTRWRWPPTGCARWAIIAAAGGLAFGLEPVPPVYGADFLNHAAEMIELVRRTGHPAIRAHLDTACVALGGDDPAAAIRAAAPMLAHYHMAEPDLGPFMRADLRSCVRRPRAGRDRLRPLGGDRDEAGRGRRPGRRRDRDRLRPHPLRHRRELGPGMSELLGPATIPALRSRGADRRRQEPTAQAVDLLVQEPLFLKDGALHLRLCGRDLPLMNAGQAVTGFQPGWRARALFTGFAPLLLLELVHPTPARRATWFLDHRMQLRRRHHRAACRRSWPALLTLKATAAAAGADGPGAGARRCRRWTTDTGRLPRAERGDHGAAIGAALPRRVSVRRPAV